jgi:hypothetical protein
MRALLLCAFAVSAYGADVTGIWLGQFTPRPGADPQDVSIQLIQTGSKISGKLYGEYKSDPIVEGTIAGELVTFVVLATEQAGNQINETRLRFTGRIQNGELELYRERESSSNAGNAGNSQTRPNAGNRTLLRLKRLV